MDLNGPLARISIYVLQIEGVGTSPGINTTRVLEGVFDASRNRTVLVRPDFETFLYPVLNTTVSVVSDWSSYRTIITSQSNFIIVNGHHEYLPVPSGHSRDEWLGAISRAIAERYAVWIHLAGYPFHKVRYEDGSVEEWGPDGFSQFMSYIGKPSIILRSPVEQEGKMVADISGSVIAYTYTRSGWFRPTTRIDPNEVASLDLAGSFPLTEDYVEGISLFPIYGRGSGTSGVYPGIVLKYQKADSEAYGLYVHLTGYKFYHLVPPFESRAEPDYSRGVLSTYSALLAEIAIPVVAIWRADDTIFLKGQYGDAMEKFGIGEASKVLAEAKNEFRRGNYLRAAYLANLSADLAENPMPRSLALPMLTIIASVAFPVALVLFVRRRKKASTAVIGNHVK